MSRTVAGIIHGFANVVTLPMNSRQRGKTIARLAQQIEQTSLQDVETSKGILRFYAGRGAWLSSAVDRFHQDEPETLEWIDTYIQSGDVFWDIGANIGLYSLYAGMTKGVDVYAFEPSGLNFSILVEHIECNGQGETVKPLCVALGDETKMEMLNVGEFAPGHASNSIGVAETQFQSFKPVFTQAIPAFTGDDFIKVFNLKAPDHIKLDVDGIEPMILKGLVKTLPKVKTMVMEVEGENAAAAAELEKPLFDAGFEEETAHRSKGSGRNRLYINKS